MNYYYDTEFLEGTQDKKFLGFKYGTTAPTIDLISIGIVSEDGREYYAISKDFNLKEAWNRYDLKHEQVSGDMRNVFPNGITKKIYWIRENVLRPIYYEMIGKDIHFHNYDQMFTYNNFKRLIKSKGKSKKQIADEVRDFCNPSRKFDIIKPITVSYTEIKNPVLYGYYSAYDHVALCWLFGKMMDLPKVFPMYTIDLKQMMDEKIERDMKNDYGLWMDYKLDPPALRHHSFEECLGRVKGYSDYPKQGNEHNALADARWNKKLHEFLIQVN